MSCPTPQPGKGAASSAGPSSTYAPSPEQLATILGSLICCDLSSQNICLKKDQIFIAHLCILLKGEMRLVRVDKCQSMREEINARKRKEEKRRGRKSIFLTCSIYSFLLCLLSFALWSSAESLMAITMQSRAALLTQCCHWTLLVCILLILLLFRSDSGKLFPSKKPLN